MTDEKLEIKIQDDRDGFLMNGFRFTWCGLALLLNDLKSGRPVTIQAGDTVTGEKFPLIVDSGCGRAGRMLARLKTLIPSENHNIRLVDDKLTVRVYIGDKTRDFHLDPYEIETNRDLADQIAAEVAREHERTD